MASVDFAAFHTEFLPAFLGDVDGLNEGQKVLLVEQYKIVQVRKLVCVFGAVVRKGCVHTCLFVDEHLYPREGNSVLSLAPLLHTYN